MVSQHVQPACWHVIAESQHCSPEVVTLTCCVTKAVHLGGTADSFGQAVRSL